MRTQEISLTKTYHFYTLANHKPFMASMNITLIKQQIEGLTLFVFDTEDSQNLRFFQQIVVLPTPRSLP